MMSAVEIPSPMKEKDILEYMRKIYIGELEAYKEPLVKSKGGTSYAFSYAEDSNKENDWRADGYRWRHNGVKKLPVGNLVIKKSYFNVFAGPKQMSRGFQRIAHECCEYPGIVVILYKGDHTIAGVFPHGNRRRDSQPHVMTMPSVLAACKNVTGNPKVIYEDMAASAGSAAAKPRDALQIQNLHKAIRNKQRRALEVLSTMQDLAYDTELTYDVITEPDLVVSLFNDKMLEQLSQILSCQPEPGNQTVSIHPMFHIGNYLVTSLLYQNNAYGECPLIPLLFFIHSHILPMPETLVWHESCKKIPKLENSKTLKLTADIDADLADDVQTCIKTDLFERIVRHLEEWDEAPIAAMLHLQKNAMKLYEMSAHYAGKIEGVDSWRVKSPHKFCDIFGVANGGPGSSAASIPNRVLFSALRKQQKTTGSGRKNPPSSLLDKARSVDKTNIKLNHSNRCFDVKDGIVSRRVTLFPEETCTCAASGACPHIVACKISLGMFEAPRKRAAFVKSEEHDNSKRQRPDEHILEVVESGRPANLDEMDVSEEVTVTDGNANMSINSISFVQ